MSLEFFVYGFAILAVLFFARGMIRSTREWIQSGEKPKKGIAAVKEAKEKRTDRDKTIRVLNYITAAVCVIIIARAISHPYWNGEEKLFYSLSTLVKVFASFAAGLIALAAVGGGCSIIFFVQIYHLINKKLRLETKLRREAENESVGVLLFRHLVTTAIGLLLIGSGVYIAYLLFTWGYPFSRLGPWN